MRVFNNAMVMLVAGGLLVIALLRPAGAEDWTLCRSYSGTKSYSSAQGTYSGSCASGDCLHLPFTYLCDWTSNCQGGSANSITYGYTSGCFPSRIMAASAATEGTIIATATWTGSGTPPATSWVREEATANWSGTAGGATGAASCGIPGTYTVTTKFGITQGVSHGERYRLVDTSSGSFTTSITGGAKVGVGAGSNRGSVDIAFTSVAPGMFVPGTSFFLPDSTCTAPWRASNTDPSSLAFQPANGGAQGGGDPVDVASGGHVYAPAPDITSYNPVGPSAVYQRNFVGARADSSYSSPGLPTGWVDTYDVRLVAEGQTPQDPWGSLRLVYPNGASELLQPQKDSGGVPTGGFAEPAGVPYLAVGVPSSTPGTWDSLAVTFTDQTAWSFAKSDQNAGVYWLSRIGSRMGRYLEILRDSSNRPQTVRNDALLTLLTFDYGANGLAAVRDAYGRKVIHTFDNGSLVSVSQIGPATAAFIPALHTYGYETAGSQPHLTSISTPSPTGPGLSTLRVDYGYEPMRQRYVVTSLTDANGNKRSYSYTSDCSTQITVTRATGEVDAEWTANFDPAPGSFHRSLGITDAKGYSTYLAYGDANNPTLPTVVTDKNGHQVQLTYDPHGNVLSSTSARGTVTTYAYYQPGDTDTDGTPQYFELGRLKSIKQGGKPATAFTYHANGLLKTATGPKPGTVNGDTVTSKLYYDDLGNMVRKESPAANDTGMIVTVWDFGPTPALGKPLKVTVTDDGGQVKQESTFGYDARGNLTSSKDALLNETDFTYNLADQLETTILPAVTQ